jgi:hypothetical protein
MIRQPCVQTRVIIRKVSRHPIIRSSVRIQKHVVRGATFGFVPDVLNDITFHHANLNFNEFTHVIQDVSTVSIMNVLIAVMSMELKKSIQRK